MDAPGDSAAKTSNDSVAGAVTPERAAYYERIGKDNLAPLWEVLKGLVPPEPRTPWYCRSRIEASRSAP
jgi:gentisate 1,2-dioxygenase